MFFISVCCTLADHPEMVFFFLSIPRYDFPTSESMCDTVRLCSLAEGTKALIGLKKKPLKPAAVA